MWPHRRQPTRLICPWNSPGKNTGVSWHFLRGSSWPWDWTWVSCIVGRHFTVWATREVTGMYLVYDLAAAKSLQLCPTLCDPIDGSLPGSPVPGILQARTLEWVAISFSNAWKSKVYDLKLSYSLVSWTPNLLRFSSKFSDPPFYFPGWFLFLCLVLRRALRLFFFLFFLIFLLPWVLLSDPTTSLTPHKQMSPQFVSWPDLLLQPNQ